MRACPSPGEVPLGVHGYVDEQRAEDEQVGAIVDGVLDERRLHLAPDGEAAGAGVRLHERQQQPAGACQNKSPDWRQEILVWGLTPSRSISSTCKACWG